MSNNEILVEFKQESKLLLKELHKVLDFVEDNFDEVKQLEEYGNAVDRIMGGAKSLAMDFPQGHFIHIVGDYSALCKAVGYKASQIQSNRQFFDICVALLMDATEMLDIMVENIDNPNPPSIDQILNRTFLDRLKWVSGQFEESVRATVGEKASGKKMNQNEIDDLMKKLGLG